MAYLHGTSGEVFANGNRIATQSEGNAFVYIGTAPVNQVVGGAKNVNMPIKCRDFAEFKKYFGYSDNWADYTLCEAAYVHLRQRGVGPIVCINVLDPDNESVRSATSGSASLTPVGGVCTLSGAENIIIDTARLASKTYGTDYSVSYDEVKKCIYFRELVKGALGTAALTATWQSVDPSQVTEDMLIGSTDDEGLNTGLYAVKNVYSKCYMIPAFLFAPGFSSSKAVHDVLIDLSHKINNHWDAFVYADLPLISGGTYLNLTTAPAWADSNGYRKENEKIFFPMAKGTDEKRYHLSVLAAANLQARMQDNGGIPYVSSSNTACEIIQQLYAGEEQDKRVYDDDIINRKLNQYGVCSAAYVGGRWAIWGAHAASYNYQDGDHINVSETCLMMLYYLSNSFQDRRVFDVDQPLTANDIKSIVAQEQERVDALIKAGALTWGEVHCADSLENLADVMMGDHIFEYNVTTAPIAKSLKVNVNHTDEGYTTYFVTGEE